MSETIDWGRVLNWRLLNGSHEFPGPQGGTCINEAAVVAAGFAYRPINDVSDCPRCFSQVFAAYLMALNDSMDDVARERLKPFVVRLAGSADADAIERRRAVFILRQTVRRILPIVFHRFEMSDIVPQVQVEAELGALLEPLARAEGLFHGKTGAYYSGRHAVEAAAAGIGAAVDHQEAPPLLATRAGDAMARSYDATGDDAVWRVGVEIAEEAFRMGAQADLIDVLRVQSRMEAIKQEAADKAANTETVA